MKWIQILIEINFFFFGASGVLDEKMIFLNTISNQKFLKNILGIHPSIYFHQFQTTSVVDTLFVML